MQNIQYFPIFPESFPESFRQKKCMEVFQPYVKQLFKERNDIRKREGEVYIPWELGMCAKTNKSNMLSSSCSCSYKILFSGTINLLFNIWKFF